jgi:adenylate kinase
LIVLLFGPPGCGKGTQATGIATRFRIPAISTGDLFRAECKAGTELGKLACSILAAGGLVGDEIVNSMVANRTSQSDCANGFLLDGYPRTIPQAQFLCSAMRKRGLPDPVVIHLDVADEVLVPRLAARRQCPTCRRIYNLLSQPPRVPDRCDDDGATLNLRDDDRESVIRQRLRAYEEQTAPVLAWYGAAAISKVDGSLAPAEVAEKICRVLRQKADSVAV